MDIVYYVVGFSLTVVGMLGGALYWLGGKFKEIDKRFKTVERELRQIREGQGELRRYVDERFSRLLNGFASYQEFFLEFLTAEDVIDKKRAELARGELWRVVKLVGANPLSKEEVERLKELIQKEELTYEEALWLREVARRLIIEYGTPETWKLHAYASIWVALARRKKAEEMGESKE